LVLDSSEIPSSLGINLGIVVIIISFLQPNNHHNLVVKYQFGDREDGDDTCSDYSLLENFSAFPKIFLSSCVWYSSTDTSTPRYRMTSCINGVLTETIYSDLCITPVDSYESPSCVDNYGYTYLYVCPIDADYDDDEEFQEIVEYNFVSGTCSDTSFATFNYPTSRCVNKEMYHCKNGIPSYSRYLSDDCSGSTEDTINLNTEC